LSKIAALLRDHSPADASEEDSLAQMREFVRAALSLEEGDGAALSLEEGDGTALSLEEGDGTLAGTRTLSRSNFVPGHFTASGVVVDERCTRSALIFHSALGLWLQPGGHFEIGEHDPLEVARREVLEETGLHTRAGCIREAALGERGSARRLEGDHLHTEVAGLGSSLLDVDVHRIPARGEPKREPAHLHFDLRFLLVAVDSVEMRVGEGVRAARWAGAGARAALDLDSGLRRALAKVFD
jgi:8-oxo-dGTP pyrophosphatase MutT (NUDIX family)